MKLKKLTFKAFRGFLDNFEFYLDGDIILLAGNNGLGKSTFFDAFEWCLTGQLKRYESSQIEKRQHPYIVNRFANGNAYVKAIFIDKGNTVEFTREGNEKKTKLSIKVNDYEIPEREVKEKQLEILVSDEALLGQIRHEDLEYLLLRSHLLEQELTSEFLRSVTPTNRFSQISKLLGADRFEAFYKKLSGSYKFIDEKLLNEEREFSKISDELDNKKFELEKERELLGNLTTKKSKEEVQLQCLKPLERLRQYLPDVPQINDKWLTFESDKFYDLIMRQCQNQRERAEILLEKTVSEKSALNEIHEEFKDIDRIIESEKKLRTELDNRKEKKEELEKAKIEPKRNFRTAEKEVTKIIKTLGDLIAKKNILKSLQERSEEYFKNKKERDISTTELKKTQNDLNIKLKTLNSLRRAHEMKRAFIEDNERQKATLINEIEKWDFVKKRKLEIITLQKEITENQHNQKKTEQVLTEKTDKIKNFETMRKKKGKEREEVLQKLSDLNETANERSKLLGTLRAHIKGSVCPLCGHDWNSMQALLKQVQKVSGRDEKMITQRNTEILKIEKEIHLLSGELNELNANVEKLKIRVKNTEKEITKLKESKDDVNTAALEYGMSVEQLLGVEDQLVEKSIAQLNAKKDELDAQTKKFNKDLTQDSQGISTLKTQINKLEIDKETKKKRLQYLTDFHREFEREAAETEISEGELSEIIKHISETEDRIRIMTEKKEKVLEEKNQAWFVWIARNMLIARTFS